MDILYELKFPDGRCWKQDGIPMEVVKYNLRTGQTRRNIYHPDGTVEKCWQGGFKG